MNIESPAQLETDAQGDAPAPGIETDAQGDAHSSLDAILRPSTLDDFVGQYELVKRLRLWLRAAIARSEPLDHVLFSGPPGLGKTTLAGLIAKHTGGRCIMASGPAIDRPADMVGTLAGLGRGDVLFIDEVHRLPRACQEYLYTAMEQFRIDVTTERGGTTSIPIEHFTLAGATTHEGLLTGPFIARFGIRERLEPYDLEALTLIAQASGHKLGLSLEPSPARTLARRCRGTPRTVNNVLKRLRDMVQVNGLESVTPDVVEAAASVLGYDANGLDSMDRRILEALAQHNGRAVGLTALGQIVNEVERTIEEKHEPFLVQMGLVLRTPKGRVITELGRHAMQGGLI
ncbi:MAG: Holliday junction branch migration DNA helicase RuvB [Planctomycetes bacterium]|nr:Holliday junction branch migration DNA helicase RuvB [Planctomycetota bacterium]